MTIPTYEDLYATYVSYYETKLGQDAPLTPKAFLRVLASIKSLVDVGLYKEINERALQNLATTATLDDLKRIGAEYGVTYQGAIAAELVLTCTGTNGVDIPAGTVFIGDTNGIRYYTQALVTIAAGTAAPTVTCYEAGVDGNLVATDTLTLSSPITGINNSAVVASVSVDGVDEEDLEVYRRQVLDQIQTVGGGSNLADYRNWAQETPDIVRAFPYSGAPTRNSVLFLDFDMEASDTSAWASYVSAVLTKETTSPHEGLRNLKVERGATANGSARPATELLNQYWTYTFSGWARGDGTCNPTLYNHTNLLWTGTSSTSWQYFSVTFTHDYSNGYFYLRTSGGASGNYTEWDDLELIVEDYPGMVTVYAECDSSYEADGIADQTLLDDVRDYINTDPITGIDRPSLGLINQNLFVEPITRTSIYVEIRGLNIAAEHETQAKADIDDDLDAYLRNATPYIAGLDTASSQADEITDPLLSKVVQDVLESYGATCSGIGIGTTPGVFIASYTLGAGELAKLGSVSYV